MIYSKHRIMFNSEYHESILLHQKSQLSCSYLNMTTWYYFVDMFYNIYINTMQAPKRKHCPSQRFLKYFFQSDGVF